MRKNMVFYPTLFFFLFTAMNTFAGGEPNLFQFERIATRLRLKRTIYAQLRTTDFTFFASQGVGDGLIVHPNGNTLLHMACGDRPSVSDKIKSCEEILTSLFTEYPNLVQVVNQPNAEGDTPLHVASRNGDFKAIYFLLSKGADIHSLNNKQQTPLIAAAAVRNQDLAVFHSLFHSHTKSDTERMDSQGKTALGWAAELGNIPLVNLLRKYGASQLGRAVISADEFPIAESSSSSESSLESSGSRNENKRTRSPLEEEQELIERRLQEVRSIRFLREGGKRMLVRVNPVLADGDCGFTATGTDRRELIREVLKIAFMGENQRDHRRIGSRFRDLFQQILAEHKLRDAQHWAEWYSQRAENGHAATWVNDLHLRLISLVFNIRIHLFIEEKGTFVPLPGNDAIIDQNTDDRRRVAYAAYVALLPGQHPTHYEGIEIQNEIGLSPPVIAPPPAPRKGVAAGQVSAEKPAKAPMEERGPNFNENTDLLLLKLIQAYWESKPDLMNFRIEWDVVARAFLNKMPEYQGHASFERFMTRLRNRGHVYITTKSGKFYAQYLEMKNNFRVPTVEKKRKVGKAESSMDIPAPIQPEAPEADEDVGLEAWMSAIRNRLGN